MCSKTTKLPNILLLSARFFRSYHLPKNTNQLQLRRAGPDMQLNSSFGNVPQLLPRAP